jgi:hypothetical protein
VKPAKVFGQSFMADKVYIVKFKPAALGGVQNVIASTVEICDEHLAFHNSKGELTALLAGDCSKLE